MSAERERDPHGIVPDAFLEQYDTDDPGEALRQARRETTTTGLEHCPRCVDCESTNITPKASSTHTAPNRREGDWKCHNCGAHFDEPRASVSEEIGRQATLEEVGDNA